MRLNLQSMKRGVSFAESLQCLRENIHVSQGHLAGVSGLPEDVIKHLEMGTLCPTDEHIAEISHALDYLARQKNGEVWLNYFSNLHTIATMERMMTECRTYLWNVLYNLICFSKEDRINIYNKKAYKTIVQLSELANVPSKSKEELQKMSSGRPTDRKEAFEQYVDTIFGALLRKPVKNQMQILRLFVDEVAIHFKNSIFFISFKRSSWFWSAYRLFGTTLIMGMPNVKE